MMVELKPRRRSQPDAPHRQLIVLPGEIGKILAFLLRKTRNLRTIILSSTILGSVSTSAEGKKSYSNLHGIQTPKNAATPT
jgi:hypothetical protein